jgi:hypothetical protein
MEPQAICCVFSDAMVSRSREMESRAKIEASFFGQRHTDSPSTVHFEFQQTFKTWHYRAAGSQPTTGRRGSPSMRVHEPRTEMLRINRRSSIPPHIPITVCCQLMALDHSVPRYCARPRTSADAEGGDVGPLCSRWTPSPSRSGALGRSLSIIS